MSKKKAKKSDLSWFNINNYSFINTISISQLLNEINERRLMIINYHNSLKNNGFFVCDIFFYLTMIVNGEPQVYNYMMAQYNEDEKNSFWDDNHLQEPPIQLDNYLGSGIVNFTYGALLHLYNKALSADVFYIEEITGELACSEWDLCRDLNLDLNRSNTILSIDLFNYTDSEIIDSLSKLLPKWRKKLEIDEPDNFIVGIQTIKKIITYNILPILDIQLWALVYNKKISPALISNLVFDEDPKDSQAIKETILPFARNFCKERFINYCNYILRKHVIGDVFCQDLIDNL